MKNRTGFLGSSKVLTLQTWSPEVDDGSQFKNLAKWHGGMYAQSQCQANSDRHIPWALWQTGLDELVSSRPMRNPILKEVASILEDFMFSKDHMHTFAWVLAHVSIHTCMYTHTSIKTKREQSTLLQWVKPSKGALPWLAPSSCLLFFLVIHVEQAYYYLWLLHRLWWSLLFDGLCMLSGLSAQWTPYITHLEHWTC